ncbi:bifunctional tetrahydrofolate synthase/dihydrofolate synthase [Shewanella sp. VB17]|uniref:bifunctional tetrahydrofolate synthase/dihydrofolate synthase n=1 Tax=Shewanella sp. VB17 TaxID=2739432 RepID=UPI001566164C|nr:bifunctional tetrahydrofolate synthase/dihydrofolate synthase [Shewanella sp. VB17]NRD74405.1 bifunctional tetrahydrofolate synthase/dihydrofolate synthase [Shewanella sp. VB17]
MSITSEKNTSLALWLDHLIAIHPQEIDMGLERVSIVADRLGLRSLGETKVVTVAGTNGKGTTCAIVEHILLLAGYTVGVYSSPHILKYNERVRINGKDAQDEQLIQAFEMINAARENISLSFFEFATLAALFIFKSVKLDVILLEVGLGGRLDATNMIDSDIAVVTSIDLDHQEYLGTTRDSVATEKAGVFRTLKPGIVGEPDIPNSLLEVAKHKGTDLYCVNQHFNYQLSVDNNQQWDFNGISRSMTQLPLPQLPLPNAATALAVIELGWPNISTELIKRAISDARLAGRLEVVSQQPLIMLDVAHNPHAARYLATRLNAIKPTRLFAVCGMLKDKDCTQVIHILDEKIDHWVFIGLDTDRSATPEDLQAALCDSSSSSQYTNLALAWSELSLILTPDDAVIVFGSFYTVAEFKALTLNF